MTQAIRILPDLSQAPDQDLHAQIAALKAENARLAAARPEGKLTLKVTVPTKKPDGTMTKGGAISVYGLGRFPVTLYRGQWERLLGAKDEIEAFIAANSAKLSVKD